MLFSFKPARLYSGSKTWYIDYSCFHPVTGKLERKKETFDMNRIKDLHVRKVFAHEIIKFLNNKLSEGFNPFIQKPALRNDQKNILDQLQELQEYFLKDATKPQREAYIGFFNRLRNFLRDEMLTEISAADVDSDIAERYQNYMVNRKLSVKTINSSISHTGMFWKHLVQHKICTSNPFRTIEPVKKSKAKSNTKDLFEPISHEELTIIFNQLMKDGRRNFWRFLAMIFYAWARPVEICRLQVKDFHLHSGNDFIKFRNTQTKNDTGAFVQIVPALKKLLVEMKLHTFPAEYFVFSYDFKPGPIQRTSKHISELWSEYVIHRTGINKKMYALKHTGNIEYLLRNKGKIDLKWQQRQNRHKTAEMTERYNRKLGAYFIDTTVLNFRNFDEPGSST